MGKRPGVMLYFDRMLFLDRLTDAQNGKILRAAILYGRDGIKPDFNDLPLQMAWDFLRPSIDGDAERYEAICEKRRESAFKRWDASACKSMPNTTTTTKTKSNTNQTHPQPQGEWDDLDRAKKLIEKRNSKHE